VFDTGSTNTWVSSTQQEYQGAITGEHLLFDPKSSSSFCDSDYKLCINFGSGKLEGFFGWDDVWLQNPQLKKDSVHIAH